MKLLFCVNRMQFKAMKKLAWDQELVRLMSLRQGSLPMTDAP